MKKYLPFITRDITSTTWRREERYHPHLLDVLSFNAGNGPPPGGPVPFLATRTTPLFT